MTKKKKNIITAVAALVLAAALISAVLLASRNNNEGGEVSDSTAADASLESVSNADATDSAYITTGEETETSDETAHVTGEVTGGETSGEEQTEDTPSYADDPTADEKELWSNADGNIKLGQGMVITALSCVDGSYVEDGSGRTMKNVVTATVRNMSPHTLQYASFTLSDSSGSYSFELSTVPAGETVRVMALGGMSREKAFTGAISTSVAYEVYFDEEPTCLEDVLAFEVNDGEIIVTNISNEALTRDVSVFFKNYADGVYNGGITYRARITDELAPGASAKLIASHAVGGVSVIMFAQYDS